MIAMSMTRTHADHRRDSVAGAPTYPAPAHSMRRAILHALSMIGLGIGGVAAVDDDTP
jgi:hypothetical protein